MHFDHESGFAHGDVVRSSHPRENAVHHADTCTFGRNERAYLCHQRDNGRLPEQGGLAAHIGAGDDDDLLAVCVQINIVGDIRFIGR